MVSKPFFPYFVHFLSVYGFPILPLLSRILSGNANQTHGYKERSWSLCAVSILDACRRNIRTGIVLAFSSTLQSRGGGGGKPDCRISNKWIQSFSKDWMFSVTLKFRSTEFWDPVQSVIYDIYFPVGKNSQSKWQQYKGQNQCKLYTV